jgi:hypothetical protein
MVQPALTKSNALLSMFVWSCLSSGRLSLDISKKSSTKAAIIGAYAVPLLAFHVKDTPFLRFTGGCMSTRLTALAVFRLIRPTLGSSPRGCTVDIGIFSPLARSKPRLHASFRRTNQETQHRSRVLPGGALRLDLGSTDENCCGIRWNIGCGACQAL